MYDAELQSKTRSTRNGALRMDGIVASLSKQKAAALNFDNKPVHDCITAWKIILVAFHATAVCVTHITFATVRGSPTHLPVYITVIWQTFGNTYQAGS